MSLKVPEEKAEATRISFTQQRVSIASQLNNMGFTVKLKDESVVMEDIEFIVEGESAPTAQISAEQQLLQLETQVDQMNQQAAMQEQQAQMQMQQMGMLGDEEDLQKAMPTEERDIDQWAEDRERKAENRFWGYKKLPGRPPKGVDKRVIKSDTWINNLVEQGFGTPLIKEVSQDGKQLWFVADGIDYVADVLTSGKLFVQKAKFANPGISYAPTQTNKKRVEPDNVQGEPYTGDVIEDTEL